MPLTSTGLRDKDIDAAVSVLRSGNLTMGTQVRDFENGMAEYLGVRHFVMTNSGSSANLLMIEALLRPTNGNPGLQPGDGVLVPALAWPTTIWPIIQLGLKPIFTDIDASSLALSLEDAQRKIDSGEGRIKAIFPIHPLGYGLDSSYSNFAERNELLLISDCCESLGSFRKGRHTSHDSLASSYSFYFSHHMTTMEGGGIATNDSGLADDLRSMRSHGWSRDRSDSRTWEGTVSENESKFLFVTSGYNLRPMEIQAAIGLSQLADLPKFIQRRQAIAARVTGSLVGSGIEVINPFLKDTSGSEEAAHSWMLLPLRVTGGPLRRDNILKFLNNKGVQTRPVLTGNFVRQPAVPLIIADTPDPSSFPITDEVSASSFLVSCHHDLSDEQVEHLIASLLSAASAI